MRIRSLFVIAAAFPAALTLRTKAEGVKPLETGGLSALVLPASILDLDGQKHAAAEAGAKATVWLFIAHDCPICNGYAPEIRRIAARYAGRSVPVHLVYSEPGLSAGALRAHAAAYHFAGPWFADLDGRLAHGFGADTTPEAVVVDAGGRIGYRGRIDDRFPSLGVQLAQPRHRDLCEALDDILAGRPVINPRTAAVGCAIEASL